MKECDVTCNVNKEMRFSISLTVENWFNNHLRVVVNSIYTYDTDDIFMIPFYFL